MDEQLGLFGNRTDQTGGKKLSMWDVMIFLAVSQISDVFEETRLEIRS